MVYGRSDATLNPGGVRIGTAELYRVVENHPAVMDSIVVGLPTAQDDVEIVLYVVLADEHELTPELAAELRSTIRAQCTPRHVPARIRACPAVPRTISGKKVEIAVNRVLQRRNRPQPRRPGQPRGARLLRQPRSLVRLAVVWRLLRHDDVVDVGLAIAPHW